jgi:hydrogenase/urease accessory protein HupE
VSTPRPAVALLLTALLLAALGPSLASAHGLEPGFLVIDEGVAGQLEVRFAGPVEQSGPVAFGGWLELGFVHIAGGVDHLLFVLGLVLLIPGRRALVAAITAFTVAHSLTLAGATLGAFSLPGPPVEATIAASIVLLAVEGTRSEAALARSRPWVVAFAFGLLHGFGFAGALLELGLPRDAAALPLLGFNLGVEAGQLAFVALVLGPVIALRRAPRRWQLVPLYALGSVATAWTIQRIVGFF